jgi:hypothetical protein
MWLLGMLVGLYTYGDDALALFQRTLLLGAADVGEVGTCGKKSHNHAGAVDGVFDLAAPDVAGSEAPGIQPSIEALIEVGLQPLGEIRAVGVA